MSNLDLFEGRKRRDEGMAAAETAARDWSLVARATADHFLNGAPVGMQFTGESVRLFIKQRVQIGPRHPNAWGAVVGGSLRRWLRLGRVRRIGIGQAHDPKSHASMLPLYEVINPNEVQS
jgi:hypothetical protein